MITTNLLPWRQKQAARAQKVMLYSMLLCLLSGGGLAYLVSLVTHNQMPVLHKNMQDLSGELARANQLLTQLEQTESDMNLIKQQLSELAQLKHQQHLPALIINLLASAANRQVQLRKVEYDMSHTRISGITLSYLALNKLAEQLASDTQVKQVEITSVTQGQAGSVYQFTLEVWMR